MPTTVRKKRYASAVRCGERIFHLRKARKLTLKQVAEKTGFSPQQIFLVEKGEINTPIETLARIAEGLSVTLADILEVQEPVLHTRLVQQMRDRLADMEACVDQLATVN